MEGDSGNKRRHSLFNALREAVGTQLDILESQLDHNNEHLSLDALERQLVAVEDFASVVVEHTHNLRIKFAREKNQIIPVHRLPHELFTHILLHAAIILDTRTVVRWATVCSIWRRIIVSTPILWRRVDLADRDILDLALSRNASVPLEVHWDGPTIGDEENEHPRAHSAHALYGSIAPRCHDLHILRTDESDGSEEILELYGAYASKIKVVAYDTMSITLPEGPNLESLMLRGFKPQSAFWSSPRFAGLHTLYLWSLRGLPTDAQFYSMLASSPYLSSLVLDEVRDLQGVDHRDLDSSAPLLLLSNLRLLHINYNVPARLAQLIATKLQCPNCHFLQLWELCRDDAIPHMPLLQSLDPAQWTSCDLGANSIITISHHDNKGKWPLEIPFPTEFSDDLFIKIYTEYEDSWRDAISALSVLIPSADTLRVSHGGPNLRELLEYGPIPWQAPKVVLAGPISYLLQAVQVLGERRSQSTSDDTSGTSLPFPRLSYFSVDTMGLGGRYSDDMDEEKLLKKLVEAVVGLAWTYNSSTATTEDKRGSRLQVVGLDGLIDGLRTKDLPLNVVLGRDDREDGSDEEDGE